MDKETKRAIYDILHKYANDNKVDIWQAIDEIDDAFSEKKGKNTAANIILDLYEIRANALPHPRAGLPEKVENLFKYNFLANVISLLQDKYKVDGNDLDEVMRSREYEKPFQTL